MRTLLIGLLVIASACTSETPLPIDVANLSDHRVQTITFDTGLDTLGVVTGLAPGERRRHVATLREVPSHDGVYGFTVRRSDGLDRTFSTMYFTGGMFADSIRIRVYGDSVVVGHYVWGERQDWVEDFRDMWSRFGAG